MVEDVDSTRRAYRRHLELSDLEVHEAASFSEASTALERITFHVACVDLGLEESDPSNYEGQRVLRKIAELAEGTRLIIVSQKFGGLALNIAIEAYEGQGLSRYLRKGQFEPDEFVEAVTEEAQKAVLPIFKDHKHPFEAIVDGLDPDVSVHNILEALDPTGGFSTVRNLVNDSLKLLCPLRPALDAGDQLTTDKGGRHVAFNAWSKAIGSGIRLILSGNDASYDEQTIIGEERSENIQGVVLRVSSASRDEYRD